MYCWYILDEIEDKELESLDEQFNELMETHGDLFAARTERIQRDEAIRIIQKQHKHLMEALYKVLAPFYKGRKKTGGGKATSSSRIAREGKDKSPSHAKRVRSYVWL